ncbi:MAG TPA: hypothetical protein VLA82_04390 [Actinomycetota bacterium]|nr:hypothetical protein [Actinomycetota bacterium]
MRRIVIVVTVLLIAVVGISCWALDTSTDVPGTIHFRNGNVLRCEVDLAVGVNETVCDGDTYRSSRIQRVEGGH